MGAHDAAAFVKPLQGHNKFKLYLTYRSYMLEMLSQLRNDTIEGQECFELMLFSSRKSRMDLEVIAEEIEKSCSQSGSTRERIFDFVIGQEDLLYLKDIEFYVLDLSIMMDNRFSP